MKQFLKRLLPARMTGASAPKFSSAPEHPPISLTREWVRVRRGTPATYASVTDAAIASARSTAPLPADRVIAAAERAMRHEFDLLGSGPFTPIDPDRPAANGYQPIDWFLDPVRQLRFAAKVPHKQWRLELRPGNADIKYPWELARCQHWVTLAQAYRMTGDERFAIEIGREMDDFVTANPVGLGVNWTCTMDVGLRAVSWVAAFDIVRECAALDDELWLRACHAMHEHGAFIRGNLENTYEVTSNHFLSNLVGLWFLGAFFAEQASGRAWQTFAREALEKEIDVQVLPDGADFESSVPYHRLVTELFLGCARLGDVRGESLSQHYRTRVRDMVAYLAAVQRPDGLMPQSGDADDGRLHVFTGTGAVTPQDARHIFGPASAMFQRDEWLAAGGESARWEAIWWGFAPSAAAAQPAVAAPTIRLFPDAGHAVARSGANYLLVTNSVVGTKGFGNHKHNDQLSFEYHLGGRPFIVDPGSYVYTADPAARNLFRGTRYHNTVMIDAVEQNEINPEWLFRTFERARPEHLSFAAHDDVMRYRGRHAGYDRLSQPVVHERAFHFAAGSGELEMTDTLIGTGAHDVVWHFHLAPGVRAIEHGHGFRLTAAEQSLSVALSDRLPRATISDAFYSPSYGVRVPCVAIDISARLELNGREQLTFRFVPQAS